MSGLSKPINNSSSRAKKRHRSEESSECSSEELHSSATINISQFRSSASTGRLTPDVLGAEVKAWPLDVLIKMEDVSNDEEQSFQDGATSTWGTNGTMKTIEFTKTQELLISAPSDPYEAFRLFFGDNILDRIVRETNINAERALQQPGITDNSRITNWKELTREELLTFLGLLLHTGTIQLNRLRDYWKKHWLFNIPCFGQFMSRIRFQQILRYLNFSSEPSVDDPLAKIRPIVDNFNDIMNNIYYPGKQLSLDQSMVLWRRRLLFRKDLKNIRYKYGTKLYVLAEPDGIVLKFQIETGASKDTPEVHTQKLVLSLLEENFYSGYSVYMDAYYNSYDLAVKLLDRETYCTGPLSEDRKGNPVDLGTVTLRPGENKSLFLDGVHIGKWKDKQNVLYISTEHDDEMIEVTIQNHQVLFKPSAIVHYNNVMSGVDLQDQMLAYYPCERINMEWYKKMFIHTLQVSLSNAFYLYTKFCAQEKINLYLFRLFILEKLLPNPNKAVHRKSLIIEHKLTRIELVKTREKKEGNSTRTIREVVRKECTGCKKVNKRIGTLYECKGCPGSPGYCTTCFCEAHSLLPNLNEADQRKSLVIEHKLTKIEKMKTREKKEGNSTRTIRERVRKECTGCKKVKKRVSSLYECKGCPGSPGYCTQCFCEAHS